MKNNTNTRSGQIVLLVILIAAILVTVALSTSQLTTQETRISKLEEDSKKAFAGAEAGLEAALRLPSGSVNIGELLGSDSGISGEAVIQTSQTNSFLVPPLKKDKMFTFYLSEYTPADPTDPDSSPSYGTAYSGKLQIEAVKPTGDICEDAKKHAVELTFINATTGDNKIATRKLIEAEDCPLFAGTLDTISYNDEIDLAQTPSHIVIVRMLASSADFSEGQVRIINAQDPQVQWPAQGKTIISTATTTTDVSKRIRLFQSYPQIPADFFVTSF